MAIVFSREDGSEYIAASWWEEMYPPSNTACIGRFTTWWQAQLSWLGLRW